MKASVWQGEDSAAVAAEAARRFCELAQAAIARSGRFRVVLSGGRTPYALYALLAAEPYVTRVDWAKVEVFWGDERLVPLTDERNNGGKCARLLWNRVAVQPEHVHYMVENILEPEAAAVAYEAKLRQLFPDSAWPQFDLVLLGLGDDGHTASLFPGAPVGQGQERWVMPATDPTGEARITLTAPVFNQAEQVWFLVTGSNKKGVLAALLNGSGSHLPAALIQPVHGSLHFLVDKAASDASLSVELDKNL